MNYRHAFHAGNHADVLKHIVLLAIIDRLKQKQTPFFVLDTHAGDGLYRLDDEQASRTGEAITGIDKLWSIDGLPPAIERYLHAVRAHNPDGQLRYYPGSPLLMAHELRETAIGPDRLVCCELQPQSQAQLKQACHPYKYVSTQQRDGYAAIGALLPPRFADQPIKRGLVLIDPPYEQQEHEYPQIIDALSRGLQRFAQGIYAVWYPIKQRRSLQPFFRQVSALNTKSHSIFELLIRPDDSALRLNGSGMLIINPPWQLEALLQPALQSLRELLGEPGAQIRIQTM